ncbi:Methyltransferase type 11 [Lysobacter dokdonensis DS-58]|uniref:Methyltransferase type 11 n=1 Tax=Lysobacter dokdonensis DS-58 TaxID=1300345 RepID=A0A0A2WJV6_9GAMM|nr:class I SAM-dependent methyltransferase [Lysobacter dokdonensis]KGQ18535.1 Methyltransferase type 11 [Lysobacter dokdonensis DS-58]
MAQHKEPQDLAASVDVVGEPWKESAYYADAEQWTFVFWDPAHPFRSYFDRLDLRNTIELACGHGRHAERTAAMAGSLTLMDIHQANLDACRARLGHLPNVRIERNNGYDFRPVEDGSATAIYCYDAMVHFSPDLVASYLQDAARVLAPGGMALFHHSNHDSGSDRHYGLNTHARNRMTLERFSELAREAGLEIADSRALDWGEAVELDGLTLVRRPA